MFINKILNSTCKEQASILHFALWENARINYLMLGWRLQKFSNIFYGLLKLTVQALLFNMIEFA